MKIKNLTIRGEKQALPEAGTSTLQPLETYVISGANRDAQKAHTIDVQSNDKLLEFVFDDGTTWMCDATTLHELFPDVELPNRAADNSFELPSAITSTSSERGIFGDMALKLLNVFAKKTISDGVGKVAEKLENKLMETGEGLFKLDKQFGLSAFDSKASGNTYLLFIHGTNSNTHEAFKKLEGSDLWDFIHTTYKDSVIAFQHRTLTKSPLQNVLELATQLPDSAELHIISHSRGGIVGDILCRYAINDDKSFVGFADANIELLRKEGNRQNDIDCIKQLNKAFVNKKIKVKKFIRVACPAAGTKLASKRLDTILNTFFNLFGGEANPVTDIIKQLLAETIKTKDNVSVLPGIEAQDPDSPFIKILNDRSDDVAMDGGSLAVISGNGKPGISINGLFVILGKLFYTQRNDLVVNTDSMYLGAQRKGNIQYFFDQGSDVNHLKYFFNNKTRQAISLALKTADGDPIPGFTSVQQYEVPASDRDLLGIEHGDLFPYPGVPSGKRPIVILLPGIMGSNLSKNGDKIWLAYVKAFFGGLMDLEHIDDKAITATSLIKTSYKQLADRLSHTYDVVVYPYDWRRQLNDCAKDFNNKIIELLKYEQPVKIIGHSMGGVLVRDFIINHDDTWKKLNASKGFKLLFLGSPLGGSFRIPTVLFGSDSIINSLNMLDRKHTKKELLTMFSTFSGILSLLPLTKDDRYDFGNINTWKAMANALGDSEWPIPGQTDLDVFRQYRDNILTKKDAIDYSNMIYIAGKDKATPCDYYNNMVPPGTELVFLYTGEGDQSVTWESGIPQQLIKSNAVYYVDVSHGALANEPDIFDGIEEILDKGFTNNLSNTRPVVRGEEQVFRMTEVFNFDLSERGIKNAVLGITEKRSPVVSQVPVSISVSNGDLAYASYPVLAGHFINDGILYAEKSIDHNVSGSLSARHHLGIYPGEVGTNTIVSSDPQEDSFPGAIIVGLGEIGKLTSYLLSKTIEQGISKYLLNLNSKPVPAKEVGISALIIGCGYGGLSVENSLKAVIEGINNANNKVLKVLKPDAQVVQHIEFIELYEDRSLSCLYALTKIESKENRIYNIRIGNKKIKKLFGSKKRMPVNASDEWWNRITVKFKEIKEKEEEISSLVFSASTGDAREEEQELFTSIPLIDLFIDQVSVQNKWTAASAKTLFELMIPNDFKDNLKKKGSICWILDKSTAAYPWELLQENMNDTKPLCIDAGMIRQLATTNYRPDIKRVATEMAFVVGDPVLNGFVNQLPGAKAEGLAVTSLLTTYGYPNISLINKTASEIVLNLFSNDYKIIHLAGHGVYDPKSRKKSGMVIGNDVFLTTADIEQMSAVPELVFVNCCHLGKVEADGEEYYRDRYKLAANIGTQLIEIGVKAVIAAGWAVDDRAASDFANIFYTRMFDGYNFGDAVNTARSAIYEKYRLNNNTWGAYQCYGDPFYKLINRTTAKKESAPNYIIEEEVEIDLNNLLNDLDTRNITLKQSLEKLKLISDAITAAEIKSGEILEKEALIYYELGEYELAIKKYEALKQEENASFSVSALEKYCNARCKRCVTDFKNGKNKGAQTGIINSIIAELKELLKIQETAERIGLIASAYKRKGIITTNIKAKLSAYSSAASYYQKAFEIKPASYALNNWIVMQTLCDLVKGTPAKQIAYGKKTKDEMIKEVMDRKAKLCSLFNNMDYWQLVDDVCYDFSLLLLDTQKAKDDANWNTLEKRYKRIWRSAGSKGKRISEVENLEIVSDMLAQSTSKHAMFLKGRIENFKSILEQELLEK